MKQSGTHTWDLFVHYDRCPFCGFIIENRTDYEYRLGKYEQDLDCPRCLKTFTVQKKSRPQFGPLFGEPQPTEVDWEEHNPKNGT